MIVDDDENHELDAGQSPACNQQSTVFK